MHTRACLKDKPPGSELLLKATDARNTASHIEPRTKEVTHNLATHTHTHTRSTNPGLNLAGRGELITKPQLIKPFTAHVFLQGEPTCQHMCVCAVANCAFVSFCVFVRFGVFCLRRELLVKGEEFY